MQQLSVVGLKRNCCCFCCCFRHSLMSDSLGPHGLQPSRLLCPLDFPGKNTGVGCHFFLQGIFLTQGLNPRLLHWQTDSFPWSHQGSPLKRNCKIIKFNSTSHSFKHRDGDPKTEMYSLSNAGISPVLYTPVRPPFCYVLVSYLWAEREKCSRLSQMDV